MANLGEYFIKMEFNFENNLRVKQQFSPKNDVQLYSTKISFGDREGQTWGRPPGPPLELPLVGGVALMLPRG